MNGYEYEPDEETNSMCVIKGMVCPFGYKFIPGGDACELKLQICLEGQ
jgi:hypothetical protein